MWDDEVDVVCCGSGFGALAAAVAAAEAGLDVHIARSGTGNPQPAPTGKDARWLAAGVGDPETRSYFDALSADLEPLTDAERDADLTVRTVSPWTPVTGRGRIAPFYGARLQEWAQRCLSSPYGVLYTQLADRGTTPMKAHTGEEIQVKVLGVLETDGAAGTASVLGDWLSAQVQDRQISISESSTLQRIVFEEGEVLGAVIDTPDGPLALRARHGVAVATQSRGAGSVPAAGQVIEPGKSLQVALVGYSASRFGRVELLELERDGAQVAYCGSSGVRDSLREPGRSHSRYRREVHRHPPFGE
jgi:hypothetical protein